MEFIVYEQKGAYGIITTHYQNLKHFADSTPGIVNGAMLYDRAEMRPLFQLQIGNPGSSFAVEIARKIGLPEEVIAECTAAIPQNLSAKSQSAWNGCASRTEHPHSGFTHPFHEIAVRQRPLSTRDGNALPRQLKRRLIKRNLVSVRRTDGHERIGIRVRRERDAYDPNILVEFFRDRSVEEKKCLIWAFHVSPNSLSSALRFLRISDQH